MALSPAMIDWSIALLEKCIVSWEVSKVDLRKGDECFNNMSTTIKSKDWYYLLNSNPWTWKCTIDTIYMSWIDKKNIGQKLNILVQKDNYKIISTSETDINKYKNLELCKPNLIVKNDNIHYYIYFSWIILLSIIFYLIYRYRKLKRNNNI